MVLNGDDSTHEYEKLWLFLKVPFTFFLFVEAKSYYDVYILNEQEKRI